MKAAIISTLLFGADALQPTKPAVAQKLATDAARASSPACPSPPAALGQRHHLRDVHARRHLGKLSGGSGITLTEEDGIDYAPTTVQLPGGERVPFLFTVKELVAKGNGGAFKPGYEGRGMTTGYDQAQALAASQTGTDSQGELEGEINKVFDAFDGTIEVRGLPECLRGRHSAFVFLIKHPYSIVIGGGSQWEKRCRRTPADVDAFLDNWLALRKLEADAPPHRCTCSASSPGSRASTAPGASSTRSSRSSSRGPSGGGSSTTLPLASPSTSASRTPSWALETEPRRLAKYEPRLAHFGYSSSRKLGELLPALRTILLTE
ncbi:hypothetical protein JL720_13713 [Aureococcus anophagefferens]|nr:hypothetical protein JL720_13713 [Aureococcus anophagefferens]